MKAIITAFFTAVNAVIVLFGGEAINIDDKLADIYTWLEELEINVD